jgi:hypothetical protein
MAEPPREEGMHVISALFLFMPSYQTTLYKLWSLALSGYPVNEKGAMRQEHVVAACGKASVKFICRISSISKI